MPNVTGALCGSKRTCGQMRMCAEAIYHYRLCGQRQLDRDSDGIPCETVCGNTAASMNARVAAEPFSPASSMTTATIQPAPFAPGRADQRATPAPTDFRCGAKTTCKEMVSCAEAKLYYTQCGVKRLDGNNDGIPCDGLCKR
ncbi:MAG: excalibur calcium-binding domain-containing protein [Hyphomicrobiaceae bacterium]